MERNRLSVKHGNKTINLRHIHCCLHLDSKSSISCAALVNSIGFILSCSRRLRKMYELRLHVGRISSFEPSQLSDPVIRHHSFHNAAKPLDTQCLPSKLTTAFWDNAVIARVTHHNRSLRMDTLPEHYILRMSCDSVVRMTLSNQPNPTLSSKDAPQLLPQLLLGLRSDLFFELDEWRAR